MAYTIPYGIGGIATPTLTATEARKRLFELIAELQRDHEPAQVTSKRGSAVLLSENDGRAVQERLCLVSIPGMRASVHPRGHGDAGRGARRRSRRVTWTRVHQVLDDRRIVKVLRMWTRDEETRTGAHRT